MDLAMELEDMGYEAERLSSLLVAVDAAIYGGVYDYMEFESALFAISTMAEEHKNKLKDLTVKVYEQVRMAKERQIVKKQEGAVDAQESEGGPPEGGPDTAADGR